MKRAEAVSIILGMMAKKLPIWLAEEDTEEGHLNNMQMQMKNHNKEIRKVLIRNNGKGGRE